jgi:hypothetical protein
MQSEEEETWIGEVIGMVGVHEHKVTRLRESSLFKYLVPKS